MSVRLVGKLLKEFDSVIAEGTKLAPETQEGIKALIKSAPEIKSGEVRIVDVVEDLNTRRNVLNKIRRDLPDTAEYIGLGSPELKATQLTTSPFAFTYRQKLLDIKKENVEKLGTYFENTIEDIKKGIGSFEDLLNSKITENTGISLNYISKAKKELGGVDKIIGPDLKEIYDYFTKFSTSEKFKKMRGGVDFTLDTVNKLKEQSRIASMGYVRSPEEAVSRFLYRSSKNLNSDVKLLNPEVGSKFREMQFQIGGKKINFKDITKGVKENDPLYSEVVDAFNYKREALKTKVMNPKTGLLEPLNKVSYDVLGTRASGLFHMSHIYDVGRTPLNYIQVTYGPYNVQLQNLLKNLKKPDLKNFLTRAKEKNVANPIAPDYIKKTPKVFAQEAADKLNEFYKLKKNNKNISWDVFLKLKKGGIVNLKYGNKFIRFK